MNKFKRVVTCGAALAASILSWGVPVTTVAAAGVVANARPVTCESSGHDNNFCAMDTSQGVHLISQESRAPCREGQSWGTGPRGVWVSEGCRGVFVPNASRHDNHRSHHDDDVAAALAVALVAAAVVSRDANEPEHAYVVHPHEEQVRCESMDGLFTRCGTGRVNYAQVQHQLSRTSCRVNESWGFDEDGLWVDRGCRADFFVAVR